MKKIQMVDLVSQYENREKEFNEVIDSWRSDHIWKYENNEWALKNPIWLED